MTNQIEGIIEYLEECSCESVAMALEVARAEQRGPLNNNMYIYRGMYTHCHGSPTEVVVKCHGELMNKMVDANLELSLGDIAGEYSECAIKFEDLYEVCEWDVPEDVANTEGLNDMDMNEPVETMIKELEKSYVYVFRNGEDEFTLKEDEFDLLADQLKVGETYVVPDHEPFICTREVCTREVWPSDLQDLINDMISNARHHPAKRQKTSEI